jgi:hypothetical protein
MQSQWLRDKNLYDFASLSSKCGILNEKNLLCNEMHLHAIAEVNYIG